MAQDLIALSLDIDEAEVGPIEVTENDWRQTSAARNGQLTRRQCSIIGGLPSRFGSPSGTPTRSTQSSQTRDTPSPSSDATHRVWPVVGSDTLAVIAPR